MSPQHRPWTRTFWGRSLISLLGLAVPAFAALALAVWAVSATRQATVSLRDQEAPGLALLSQFSQAAFALTDLQSRANRRDADQVRTICKPSTLWSQN